MSLRCKLKICETRALINDGLAETPEGKRVFATTRECPRCHRESSVTWPIEKKVKWLKENGLDYRFVK